MSLNNAGTYTLPAGNPYTTGTVIRSNIVNTTFTDVGAEITSSLDRNGRGAMLAALKITDGTVAAPGLTFSQQLDAGLYRAGSHDVRMGINSALVQKWTTAGVAITGTLSTTGAATLASAGVTGNQTVGGTLSVTGNAAFTANIGVAGQAAGSYGIDSGLAIRAGGTSDPAVLSNAKARLGFNTEYDGADFRYLSNNATAVVQRETNGDLVISNGPTGTAGNVSTMAERFRVIQGTGAKVTGALEVTGTAALPTIDRSGTIDIGTSTGTTITIGRTGQTTSLQGDVAVVAPTPTAPTLINGWAAGTPAPRYFKDALGIVHLEGILDASASTAGAGGNVAFQLPSGFRPPSDRLFAQPVLASSSVNPMAIDSSGNVSFPVAHTGSYALDGVTFATF